MSERAMRAYRHAVCLVLALAFATAAAGGLSAMVSTLLITYNTNDATVHAVCSAVIAALVFLLTVRAFVAHDELFCERYAHGQTSVMAHIRAVVSTPLVWVELAVCLASLAIAVMHHPMHAPLDLWQPRGELTPSALYARACLVSLPLYTVLYILAHLLARRPMRDAYARAHSGAVGKKRASRVPRLVRHLVSCVLPTLVLSAVCAVLPLAVSVLRLAIRALGNVTVWIVLGVVVLYLAVIRYARAMRKRRRFRKELLRLCESTGSEVIFHRSVHRSLFIGTQGADFTLWHKGRRYDGKFLHSLRSYTPMLFDGSGQVELHRIYKIRHVELFRTVSTQPYAFASEGERVLIILPTPKKLLWTGGGARHMLDVGDRVGEYILYNATGFLRAIERDCVGRSATKTQSYDN